MLPTPVNISHWIFGNQNSLHPPINNKVIQQGDDFFLMAIGGPNRRTDYHVNPMEEWFYQLKGDLLLKVADCHATNAKDRFRDILIREGECFLLPAQVPHNPIRFPDTFGLVMERRRIPGQHLDHLQWYCEACRAPLHEETFFLEDVEVQIKQLVEKFEKDKHLRTCTHCGATNRSFIPSEGVHPQH